MVQKSLFPVLILILVFAGCSVGITDIISPIRITRIDGGESVISVGETIQLEVSPLGPSDTVEWTIHDSSDPDGSCASVDQTGLVHGISECDSISIIAESTTGAVDSYPLVIQTVQETDTKPVTKPR